MLRSLAFVAALLPLAVHAQDEEEGRSVLLLYKKMEPMEGFAIGEPINVTLSVFNKGLGNAYSIRSLHATEPPHGLWQHAGASGYRKRNSCSAYRWGPHPVPSTYHSVIQSRHPPWPSSAQAAQGGR